MKPPKWSVPHIPNLREFLHRTRVLRVYRAFLRCTVSEEEKAQVRDQFKANRNVSSLKEATHMLKSAEMVLSSLANQRAPKSLMPQAEPLVKKGDWPWER